MTRTGCILIGGCWVLLVTSAFAGNDERILRESAWEGDKITHRLDALQALLSAAEHPDQRLEILRYVESSFHGAKPVPGEGGVESNRRAQGLLILQYFLEKCTGYLTETPTEKRELMALLLRICEGADPILPGETSGLAYRRLVELADEKERAEYNLSFIEQQNNAVGRAAVGALNRRRNLETSTLEQLRVIALDSLRRGRANVLALDVLGHHGDRVILDDLNEHRAKSDNSESTARAIDRAIAQIVMQHPRERLLELLRSGEADLGARWIVERAAQLGFPVEELRGAVLEYYRRCPKERLKRVRIWGFDRAVIETGILSASELPSE